MTSSSELISLIKGFSISDRLIIVEEILKDIRQENLPEVLASSSSEQERSSKPSILSLAGIFDEGEAAVFTGAIEESRKIDSDEW